MKNKPLEYELYFRSDEFIDKINKELEHEQLKSFNNLLEDAVNEIVEAVYDLANKNGFYHTDQINLKVNIDFKENEG